MQALGWGGGEREGGGRGRGGEGGGLSRVGAMCLLTSFGQFYRVLHPLMVSLSAYHYHIIYYRWS